MRVRWAMAAVVVVSLAASPFAQSGDTAAVVKRLDSLDAAVKAMQKQLDEIKTLLQQARPAPAPSAPSPVETVQGLETTIAGVAAKGPASAKLALIEFSDFQCPFCG